VCKSTYTGGSLLADTVAVLQHVGVLIMDKGSQVTTVIQNQVEGLAILEGLQLLAKTPLVLFFGLALPCEDGDTSRGDSSCGVILRRENVATRPGDLGAQGCECLDQNGGLNGHVEATCDTGASEGLVVGILGAGSHEARHLLLGELDLAPAKGRQRLENSSVSILGTSRDLRIEGRTRSATLCLCAGAPLIMEDASVD